MKIIIFLLGFIVSFSSIAGDYPEIDYPELNKVSKDARKSGICLVVYNGAIGLMDSQQLIEIMRILADSVKSHGNTLIAEQVAKEMAFVADDFDLTMEYGKNFGCFKVTKELVAKGLVKN